MIKLTVKLCLANGIDYCKPMQCNPIVKVQFYSSGYQKSDYQHGFILFPPIFAWFGPRKVIRDFLAGRLLGWPYWYCGARLCSTAWQAGTKTLLLFVTPRTSPSVTRWEVTRLSCRLGCCSSCAVWEERREVTGNWYTENIQWTGVMTLQTTTSPPRLIVPSHWGSDHV